MQLDYSAVWERPQFRAANGRALVEGMRVGVAVCLLRSARSQFVRATIVALCSLVSVVGVSSAHAASGASPSIGTTDDLLASVGEQVPAFGGMYVDEGSGNLYIWLTDQGQSLSSAARALQGVLGDRSLAGLTPVALPAKYTFIQLKAWSDAMAPVLSIPGVVSTDIDDRNNRLSVGVEDPDQQGPLVQTQLRALGIPVEVVEIVKTEPVTFTPINHNQDAWLAVIIMGSVAVFVACFGVLSTVRRRGYSLSLGWSTRKVRD